MRLCLLVLGSLVTLGALGASAGCSSFSEADEGPGGAETGAGDSSTVEADAPAETSLADAAAPKVLASGLGDALTGIDTNGTAAFVIDRNAGAIVEVGLEIGESKPLPQVPKLSPSAILAYEDRVVWADFGHDSLFTMRLDGSQAQKLDLTMNSGVLGSPSALAHIPGPSLLFLMTTNTSAGGGDVSRWATGLVEQGELYENPQGANLFDVAATATALYWTESSTGTVWSVPNDTSGTAPAPVATGQSDCESIAAEGTDVYWALPQQGLVRTGTGTDFARNEMQPFSLAADATGAYWLTSDGTLRRAPRGGGAAVTLASGFASAFADPHVQAIALTSAYVVWITSDGQVLRLAK